MDVRGSRGNSPVTRHIQGEYTYEDSRRQKSPGFVQPLKGTNLTTEGVRTIGGGIESMKPGQIRGGFHNLGNSISKFNTTSNTETFMHTSITKFDASPLSSPVKQHISSPIKTSTNGGIRIGASNTGRTTGVYTGGGIISKNISGTRGLNY